MHKEEKRCCLTHPSFRNLTVRRISAEKSALGALQDEQQLFDKSLFKEPFENLARILVESSRVSQILCQ